MTVMHFNTIPALCMAHQKGWQDERGRVGLKRKVQSVQVQTIWGEWKQALVSIIHGTVQGIHAFVLQPASAAHWHQGVESFFLCIYLLTVLKGRVSVCSSTLGLVGTGNPCATCSSCLFCPWWRCEQRWTERRRGRWTSGAQTACFWRGTLCCRSHSGGSLPSGGGWKEKHQ